jgi:hypothetical protein
VIIVLKLLRCQVELTSSSFALGVTAETLLGWWRRAAEQATEINHSLLRAVQVTHVQLDEMWSFIRRTHSPAAGSDGASPEERVDGRQGVGVSCAPEYRLVLAAYGGPRTLQSALLLVQRTAAVVLGVPCCFRAGFSRSLSALVAVYHEMQEWARTGKRGRPRQPVQEPHPDLVAAQLIKHKHQGRRQTLTARVCGGAARLTAWGLKISTSVVERLNLPLRQAFAPLTRTSLGFCKDREQWRRRVVFFQAFDNFARPHQRLRCPLPTAEPSLGGLMQPKWQPCTPGMAAGLTDHVWTFRELLTAKFEPILNQNTSG